MDISRVCNRIIENPLETDWPGSHGMIRFLNAFIGSRSGQTNIVKLSGMTIFSGDIHGDIDSMLTAFKIAEQHNAKIVFLGDVVDRGSHDLECVNLLLARILLEPDRVFYTRGNHEFRGINSRWGFRDAVLQRYPPAIFDLYNEVFTKLPIAALWNNRIYGIHGGISRNLNTLADIEALEHESMTYRDEYMDLLWNDPAIEPQKGFEPNNKRNIFYTFGQDVFDDFMQGNGLDLLIRGHNVQKHGYRYFFDKRLISIFTSRDFYKDTKPSVVLVDDDGSHEIIAL